MEKSLTNNIIKFLAIGVLTLALVPAIVSVNQAYGVTAAQKEAEAHAALQQLNKLSAELDSVSDIYFGAIHDKEEAEAQMVVSQQKIEEANAQIDKLQERISTRVKSMYKTGAGSMLDLLFQAKSFSEFATYWNLLMQMNANDADLISETKTLRESIEQEKANYAAAAQAAQENALSVQSSYERALSLKNAAQNTYNSLSAEAMSLVAAEQAAQNARYQSYTEEYFSGYGNEGAGNGGIVSRAYSKLGAAYEWAAAGPDSFDCSGFVGYCYGYSGHVWTSYSLYSLPAVSDPQPGDVVVTNGHAAIYVGDGMIVHAKDYGYGVVEESINHMGGSYKIVRP